MKHSAILDACGLLADQTQGGDLSISTPIDGAEIARLKSHSTAEAEAMISASQAAFKAWRQVPAPRRGELVRLLGEELRAAKEALGALVTLECGKILQEGLGEVQEMIDRSESVV